MKLIDTIFPLVGALSSVTSKIPEVFLKVSSAQRSCDCHVILLRPQVDSDVLRSGDGTEAVLDLWTRESPHNYENNMRIHEVSRK